MNKGLCLFFGIPTTVMMFIALWVFHGTITFEVIVTPIVTGVLFGMTYPAFARKLIERRMSKIKVELDHGEAAMKEGPANYFQGHVAVGGKLVVTSKRLIFQPLRKQATIIPLERIKTTSTGKSIGLFPNVFRLQLNDDRNLKFVVDSPEDWVRLTKSN
jgi:hypothetical protein